MKCRKGDYVTFKNGKRCKVVHGSNKEEYGMVEVVESFPEIGWTQKTNHWTKEIIKVERY